MEEKSHHPISKDSGDLEVARSLRDMAPAHYTLKIEAFSLLSQIWLDSKELSYESECFEAGGYKWKLSLYPKGDKESNGEGHISLYLVITETDNLPPDWEVNVNFKLFVFDQIRDKYMTIQDANGRVRHFNRMETEWGFAQLLPLSVFHDAANGYLIRDTCVFGAEVFVVKYNGRGDCLYVLKELGTRHTWKIDEFSSLGSEIRHSNVFTIGDRKWMLRLYPKGNSKEKNKNLSLFIVLEDFATSPLGRKTYATFKLRIRSAYVDQHVEVTGSKCFSAASFLWGRSAFLPLTSLHDAYKGFLVNDTLVIEAEVKAISTEKNFSNWVPEKLLECLSEPELELESLRVGQHPSRTYSAPPFW